MPTAVGVVLFGVGLSLLVQVPLPAVVAVVVSVVVVQFRRITVTVDKTHPPHGVRFPRVGPGAHPPG